MATFAIVMAWPYSKNTRLDADNLYDAMVRYATHSPPSYTFTLMVIEGQNVSGTVAVAFFNNEDPAYAQAPGTKLSDNALSCQAWLKTAAGHHSWGDIEFYGPKFWGIEKYFGPISVLRQQRLQGSFKSAAGSRY